MVIEANQTYYQTLNAAIHACPDREIIVDRVLGQRYLGCGSSGRHFTLRGTPGNGLGQYLNGSTIEVFGNCQEAVGDTMNDGDIIVHGNCGDACGYGMRGGSIFIEGNVGYRAGIHMKSYLEKSPLLVVGGSAGSFLGEYQAGGTIVVLGLDAGREPLAGNFCGMGMYGGKIFLRGDRIPVLPRRLILQEASPEDLAELQPILKRFCRCFHRDPAEVSGAPFHVITPDSANPYQQLYAPY